MPCEATPMASPRAAQFLIPIQFISGGPSMAPQIPVKMTSTAVREGKPPNCSEIPMATEAVTDLGAMEIMDSCWPPSSHTKLTALTEAATEPDKMLTRMANDERRTFSNCL